MSKPAEEEKGNKENIFNSREGRKHEKNNGKHKMKKNELKISSNITINLSNYKYIKNWFKKDYQNE